MKVCGRFLLLFGVLTLGLALLVAGCGQREAMREKLQEIGATLNTSSAGLKEATSFIDTLEGFDLDDPAFVSHVLESVAASRSAAQNVLESAQELESHDFEGELTALGSYIMEYTAALDEAVRELEAVYAGLSDILRAVEPVLQAEAEIIRIEQEGTLSQWLEQIGVTRSRIAPALEALEKCEVPAPVDEFKAFFVALLHAMDGLFGELAGKDVEEVSFFDLQNNPGYVEAQGVMDGYPAVVRELEGRLEQRGLDLWLERVELEMNRLYLQTNQE